MKHINMSSDSKNRRLNVIGRLENQLKIGKKVKKQGEIPYDLTESDISRIKKEIEILKTKI